MAAPDGLQDDAVGDKSVVASIGALNLEQQLPPGLQALIAQLTAVRPTIDVVALDAGSDAGDYFRAQPQSESDVRMWSDVRMRVLGLIATCPSLRVVVVAGCGISKESEVQRLCEGLKSNTVLHKLILDGNTGFGSDFGCRHVSHILASSTTLEELRMDSVGMRVTGLSQLVGALVANPGSRLQTLDLEGNRDLGDAGSGELLAQLLSHPRTSKWLKELAIRGVGLTVGGAVALSPALAQSALETFVVGTAGAAANLVAGEEAQEEGPLKTILSSVRCSTLVLTCSREKGLAECLAQMLQSANTTLKMLCLFEGQFSTHEWRCIFRSLSSATWLHRLVLHNCTSLDHHLIEDLQQLHAVNPSLQIANMTGAPLEGSGEEGFYCTCPSCIDVNAASDGTRSSEAAVAMNLTRLMNELGATNPSIARINIQDLEFMSPTRGQLQDGSSRRRILELIGTCSSLRSITLSDGFIGRDDRQEIDALCTGLASNPVLEELILGGNEGFGTRYGCEQLAKVVSGCTRTLRTLKLANVDMRSTGLVYLTQALQQNNIAPVLQILHLNSNFHLGDTGAGLIAQLLTSRTCTALDSLCIADIGMGVTGAHSLSLALQHNASITRLVVGESFAGAPVGVLLRSLIHQLSVTETPASGPCNNRTLTSIVLVSTQSAEILAQVLETNTTLEQLGLVDCPLPPQDWKRVFKALQRNEVLQMLDFNYVGVDLEPVFKDLLELLQVNTTLQEIKLDKTDLSRKGKVPLVEEALRRNKQQVEYLAVLKAKLPLAQPSTGRLFLCGSPFAGKTTLRESMVRWHRKRNLSRVVSAARAWLLGELRLLRARTKGIEIEVLREDEEMQISIWDMAGQEQYHALHDHLFPNTSQACMFVFVYNPVHNESGKLGVLDEHHFRDQLLYWLRFIASNWRITGHVLPLVSVVITHLDKLPSEYDAATVVNWAEATVVGALRDQFAEVVQVHPKVSAVKAYSATSVGPIVEDVFVQFQQLLQHTLPPVVEACAQMSLALARRTLQQNTPPMVRTEEFFTMCGTEVEALRDLLRGDPSSASGTAVEAYLSKTREAVAAYLHDVGSIVHFRDLDFVVVNPNWLGNVFLSRFIRVGTTLRRSGILPSTQDGFIDEFELKGLLAKFLQKSRPRCSGFSEDDLLQLLVKLELCYREDSSSTKRVRYFVPSSLSDRSGVALNSLQWQVPVTDVGTSTHVGVRLQCDDEKKTFLTPGFFPRLQVYLRRALQESHQLVLVSEQYTNEQNLIRICLNGCEILVESSGDNGIYMDILVRSEKHRYETWDLVQRTIVKEIQAFCKTPQGCPGVELIEYIVRPECVQALTSCLDRRDQAIKLEALKEDLVADILSKTESLDHIFVIKNGVDNIENFPKEMLNYAHYWPPIRNSNIGKGFTKAMELLDIRAIVDILERKKDSLTKVKDQIGRAVDEVMVVRRGLDDEDGASTSGPYFIEELEDSGDQSNLERRLVQHFDRLERKLSTMDGKLDQQRDLLLQVVPNLVKELKSQQLQMQSALTSGVDYVLRFIKDVQTSKIPRLPYFTDTDVGMYQRFVAFFRIGSAIKLHFMCEDRGGMHFVENQEGYDVIILNPQYETLRSIALCSAKVLYILVKSGLQVGAGVGGVVPEFTSCGGEVLPIASQFMENVLNDIKLNDQSFASNQADALVYLQDLLKGKSITTLFQLYKVEYLEQSVASKSPRFGWVCRKCRDRGLAKQNLKDCI